MRSTITVRKRSTHIPLGTLSRLVLEGLKNNAPTKAHTTNEGPVAGIYETAWLELERITKKKKTTKKNPRAERKRGITTKTKNVMRIGRDGNAPGLFHKMSIIANTQ